MIPKLLLLVYLFGEGLSEDPTNSFSCGKVECYPDKTEVCVETIDEKEKKIEQLKVNFTRIYI